MAERHKLVTWKYQNSTLAAPLPGFFKKQHPFDCGRPQCPVCRRGQPHAAVVRAMQEDKPEWQRDEDWTKWEYPDEPT